MGLPPSLTLWLSRLSLSGSLVSHSLVLLLLCFFFVFPRVVRRQGRDSQMVLKSVYGFVCFFNCVWLSEVLFVCLLVNLLMQYEFGGDVPDCEQRRRGVYSRRGAAKSAGEQARTGMLRRD